MDRGRLMCRRETRRHFIETSNPHYPARTHMPQKSHGVLGIIDIEPSASCAGAQPLVRALWDRSDTTSDRGLSLFWGSSERGAKPHLTTTVFVRANLTQLHDDLDGEVSRFAARLRCVTGASRF